MSLYVPPRTVDNPADCLFYHVVDLPDGPTDGRWDLRETVDAYLGHQQFGDERVLDVGTANGFLAYHAEQQGAEVVGYDLGPGDLWDLLCDATDAGIRDLEDRNRREIARLENAFWYCHRRLGSKVRLAQGTAYAIPSDLGRFDTAILGAVLLHLRDPLGALQQAAAVADKKVVVVDLVPKWPVDAEGPLARFRPCPDGTARNPHSGSWHWWELKPELIVNALHLLGFPHTEVSVSRHHNLDTDERSELFTIVARRGR